MYAEESWINETEGYRVGDSGLYETYTDNVAVLFLDYQREYGRCVSKVYVDEKDQTRRAIGWVFQKRVKYTDCKDTYLQETWITLHDAKPDHEITYHYHELH